MIDFSIIIPHHNIPSLLQRCLDSIPERDDLEVIIVDDNSSTSKVDFKTFPGLNKRGITCIFDKEGGGAGYARNLGLDAAVGKWIMFADADDFYNTNALNALFDKYKKSDFDIVYFNALSIYDNGEKCKIQCRINQYFQAIRRKKKWGFEGLRYNTWEPWTKMVRKSYIDRYHLRFQEIFRRNDLLFGVKANVYTTNFSIYDKVVYYYVQRQNSIVHTKQTEQQFNELVDIRFAVDKLYAEQGIKRQFCILHLLYLAYKQNGITEVLALYKKIKQNHIGLFRGVKYYIQDCYRVKK